MGDEAKRLELSMNDRLGAAVERAVSSELGKSLKNKATVVAVGRFVILVLLFIAFELIRSSLSC